MDPSSLSAAESVSEVSARLIARAEDMSAHIYRLIVQEIPQLRNDKRVLALLEASVAANVTTLLQIWLGSAVLRPPGKPGRSAPSGP